MKSAKLFCLLLMLCFSMPTAFAIITPSSIQSTTKTTIPSEQKHELRKEKTSVFEKYLLKNSLKKAHSRSTADGVTTVLCGLASIIFFSMAANATGLLSGIISALLFGTISLVFAILCFIFMIRWAINLSKKEAK